MLGSPEMNIVNTIFETAISDGIALMHNEDVLSFGELRDSVERSAETLKSSRLWPTGNDIPVPRIGLSCPNGFEHVVLSLAVLRAGGVLVPVAPELAKPEKQALADTTALHAVISTAGEAWLGDASESEDLNAPCGLFRLHRGVTGDATTPPFPESAFNELNPALVRFSSGTTGSSKGVVLSHSTLVQRVRACNLGLKIGPATG